jgi:hypothetical protein
MPLSLMTSFQFVEFYIHGITLYTCIFRSAGDCRDLCMPSHTIIVLKCNIYMFSEGMHVIFHSV